MMIALYVLCIVLYGEIIITTAFIGETLEGILFFRFVSCCLYGFFPPTHHIQFIYNGQFDSVLLTYIIYTSTKKTHLDDNFPEQIIIHHNYSSIHFIYIWYKKFDGYIWPGTRPRIVCVCVYVLSVIIIKLMSMMMMI